MTRPLRPTLLSPFTVVLPLDPSYSVLESDFSSGLVVASLIKSVITIVLLSHRWWRKVVSTKTVSFERSSPGVPVVGTQHPVLEGS